MQEDTKTVLQTTDIAAHLKTAPKPLTDIELQQDYDYGFTGTAGITIAKSECKDGITVSLSKWRSAG